MSNNIQTGLGLGWSGLGAAVWTGPTLGYQGIAVDYPPCIRVKFLLAGRLRGRGAVRAMLGSPWPIINPCERDQFHAL